MPESLYDGFNYLLALDGLGLLFFAALEFPIGGNLIPLEILPNFGAFS